MVKKCKARKCPICNSETVEFIREIKMTVPEEFRLPNGYDVVSCVECGFVYADTTATKEDYDYYYENCNWYGGDPKIHDYSNFRILNDLLESFLDKEKSHILDLGVGSCTFISELAENDYKNLSGLDPSESSVDLLQKLGFCGVKGSVYDTVAVEYRNNYDAVFLLGVIEHLYDPLQACLKIRDYLKKDGFLFLTVPDCLEMDKVTSPIPDQFNLEHINYFSSISLENMLKKCGMEKIADKQIIHIENGYPQPILVCVFKKINVKVVSVIEKDLFSSVSIKKYFEDQQRNIEKINATIDELIVSNEPIVIWGTGSYVMSLLEQTNLVKCNILKYIDNNSLKCGKEILGKPIDLPSKLTAMNTEKIIICSMLHSTQIVNQIKEMGLNNEVIVL